MNLFEHVLEQFHAKRILRSCIEADLIGHAYIFVGPDGVGKKTTALAFAQAVMCRESVGGCGECGICTRIASGQHPDVRIVEETKKKSLGVPLIRELKNEIIVKPHEGLRKIYIIDKVETMTNQAQNAFLKMLEEPPSYVLFVLLANNVNRILPTVLSRCQHVRFTPLSEEIIKSQLLKNGVDTAVAVDMVTRLSSGSLGKGIYLATNVDLEELQNQVTSLLRAASTQDKHKLLMLAQQVANSEHNTSDRFLDLLEEVVRDRLYSRREGSVKLECEARFSQNPMKLLRAYKAIVSNRKAIEQYQNKQLAFEALFLTLSEVM